jgi:hypothetical protein
MSDSGSGTGVSRRLPGVEQNTILRPSGTEGSIGASQGRDHGNWPRRRTGCETVNGVGPVRWTALSPGFWSVLATAARIGPDDQATFAGTL